MVDNAVSEYKLVYSGGIWILLANIEELYYQALLLAR